MTSRAMDLLKRGIDRAKSEKDPLRDRVHQLMTDNINLKTNSTQWKDTRSKIDVILQAVTGKNPTGQATGQLRISADGRTIRRGKNIVAKLSPTEGRWVEECIRIYTADGEEEYDVKEISLAVFGKTTRRFCPSQIFPKSGSKLFHAIFEHTDLPGVVMKKANVIFETTGG